MRVHDQGAAMHVEQAKWKDEVARQVLPKTPVLDVPGRPFQAKHR